MNSSFFRVLYLIPILVAFYFGYRFFQGLSSLNDAWGAFQRGIDLLIGIAIVWLLLLIVNMIRDNNSGV